LESGIALRRSGIAAFEARVLRAEARTAAAERPTRSTGCARDRQDGQDRAPADSQEAAQGVPFVGPVLCGRATHPRSCGEGRGLIRVGSARASP